MNRVLPRLEGGIIEIDIGDGSKLFAHHPTAEEISAALAQAGVDLARAQRLAADASQSLEALEATARMGHAYELLAAYCVERAEIRGSDAEANRLYSGRIRGPYGLRLLSESAQEAIGGSVLMALGKQLFSLSSPTQTEGEH